MFLFFLNTFHWEVRCVRFHYWEQGRDLKQLLGTLKFFYQYTSQLCMVSPKMDELLLSTTEPTGLEKVRSNGKTTDIARLKLNFST